METSTTDQWEFIEECKRLFSIANSITKDYKVEITEDVRWRCFPQECGTYRWPSFEEGYIEWQTS